MESEPAAKTKGRIINNPFHILVVEDDDVSRKNVVKVLTDEGHRVTSATNGDEGIQYVLTDPPDIILTNLRMPKLDGLDLLTRVGQAAPHIPVLLMTALTTSRTKRRARALGAEDFIEKPFDFDDLLHRIERALAPYQ